MSDQGITTFKCEDEKSIIAASKLVWNEGVQPHRIVLRKLEANSMGATREEYVTHQENLSLHGDTWKHRDFYWGHYHGINKEAAVEDFNARCKKL